MKRIDELIASGKYTYRNRSDFVLDALELVLTGTTSPSINSSA